MVGVIDFDEREGPQDKYIDDGVVLAYHQNDFGFWEQTEYPFIHSTTYVEFGQNIDIDDDLACVVDAENVHLFHQKGGTIWTQFDVLIGEECHVSGNTIAIASHYNQFADIHLYEYDRDRGAVSSLKDPIRFVSTTDPSWYLSNDHLVYQAYDDNDDEFYDYFIYHRESSGMLVFQQRLNVSVTYTSNFMIDKDILVFSVFSNEDYYTYIYSEQNGYWVESIVLH